MTATLRPLRQAVAIEPAAAGSDFPAILDDPDLGQRVKLDARGLEVARALDREQTLDELCVRLSAEPGPIAKVIDFLRRLHLLDTDEARAFVAASAAGRAWQDANPADVPLLIRDDAAFTCSMCGSCCGGHNVGPVSNDVLDGLRGLAAELTAKTRSQKGLFFTLPVKSGAKVDEQVVCHSRGGSCIFLSDERRCLIHQDLGPTAKPAVCRLFPYYFVATPRGIAVSLQMECRGFPEARHGKPLKAQEAEIRELLALVPRLSRVRPVIALDETRTLAYEAYEAIEEALHGVIDAHPTDGMGALLSMRATLEEERGRDPAAPVEGSDVETLRADLDALCGALLDTLGGLHELFGQSDERHVVHTESLDQIADALRTLRPEMRRVVAPLERGDQQALFRDMAHHHLMGKELTRAKTLVLGLARLTFGWFLAKALMIHRAREVKRRHLVAQDVTDAIVVTHFQLRNTDFLKALQTHDAAIVSLFYDRLPALVHLGGELPDPDRRLELYKF